VTGLKVVPIVKPAEVLALLNLQPLDPATLLKIERYNQDFVSSGGKSADVKRLFRYLNVSEAAEFERPIIATKLRQCVDEWLETGWSESIGESPERRSLIKAPLAMKILQDFTSQLHPRLRFLRVPSEFVIEVGSSGDPTHTSTTSAFVDRIDKVRRDVARLFFGLITSDWGPRLCKCRYCNRYFVHPKPRRRYKHGTFCGNHQMSWYARRRVMETRRLIHSALLDIAAKELMKRRINGPQWQEDSPRKIQLANDVSTWIRKNGSAALRHFRSNVKLTWVTRNSQEIEKRRQELGSISTRELQAPDYRFILETVARNGN
jgi:hypothetical protein